VKQAEKTSVDFQLTTGRYIPEDRTLQSKTCIDSAFEQDGITRFSSAVIDEAFGLSQFKINL
jgi:hypothetical protein